MDAGFFMMFDLEQPYEVREAVSNIYHFFGFLKADEVEIVFYSITLK